MSYRVALGLLLLALYGLAVYSTAPSPLVAFLMAVFPGIVALVVPERGRIEDSQRAHEPITVDSFTLFSRTRSSV